MEHFWAFTTDNDMLKQGKRAAPSLRDHRAGTPRLSSRPRRIPSIWSYLLLISLQVSEKAIVEEIGIVRDLSGLMAVVAIQKQSG